MKRTVTVITVMLAVAIALSGCRTFTGRTARQWADDKATTARVKAALGTQQFSSLTKVDVDTNDGTVFLTGNVRSEQAKQQLDQMAQVAARGRPVVSQLTVAGTRSAARSTGTMATSAAGTTGAYPAASGPTGQPSVSYTVPATVTYSQPGGAAASQAQAGGQQMAAATAGTRSMPPALSQLFGRMEPDGTFPNAERFAAYGQTGERVATVYAVPAEEIRQHGVSNLSSGERPIRDVSIYPPSGSQGMQYHVVLWHVEPPATSRMR